ncbi:GPP34 family phosphoprotein [Salinicoccus cyprini]|uniref:GPP34 family phosphoprotein n=1 Tax=Salinicoccus cyprini TaxID=2493691 RepID=A0A558AU58_9STAP|nr:GPP34 family phosphoprotein [Salinicoccus cyprini]TVT27795.1 GPP34 family phosphoprotein [Salinicoccus cyprini]
MFTIAEALLLLATDDDKGTQVSTADSMEYGFTGAILSELTLMERIELQDEKVVVIDRTPTGVPYFETVLDEIENAMKPEKIEYWVDRLPFKMHNIKKEIIQSLVEKGILKEESKKILFVFNQKMHPEADGRVEQEIRSRLQRIVFDNETPDPLAGILLNLIKICNLTAEVFGEEKKETAEKRIEKIAAESEYDVAINKSIEQMEAAIMIATTTAISMTVINNTMPPNN